MQPLCQTNTSIFPIVYIAELNLITILRCMESFRLQKYPEIAQI